MKKWFGLGLVCCWGLLFLNGCSGTGDETAKTGDIAVPSDLNKPGMIIGVPQGAASMTASEKFFDRSTIQYFNSLTDGYMAVQQKKIDAFVFDRHSMEYVVKVNPALVLLPDDIGEEHIVIGAPKRHQQLMKKVNEFIRLYLADGTQKDMCRRWYNKNHHSMPEIPVPEKPSRKLIVGTEGLNVPMNFFDKDGKITGFDVEFARRLASYLNVEIEIVTMSFDALIPAVEAGKLDLLIANLNATAERKEKMLMSEDYVDSAISIMVHEDRLKRGDKELQPIRTVQDLEGRKVASLTGAAFPMVVNRLVKNVEYHYFNDQGLSVQALRSRKVDGVLVDEPVGLLYAANFSDELHVPCVFAEDSYGFACRKGSPLIARASAVIRKMKSSGEMDKLKAKWCGADRNGKVLERWTHRKDYTGRNGKLVFAADPSQEPICYMGAEGELVGLDLDVMHRIAYDLDMKLVAMPMNFGALIEALLSGRADMVGGGMSITEERKEKVDFTETHYLGGMCILARLPRKPGKAVRTDKNVIRSVQDLAGKKAACITGSALPQLTKRYVKNVEYLYYNDQGLAIQALRSKKTDAVLLDEPVARLYASCFAGELHVPSIYAKDSYGFACRKGSALTAQASAVVRELKRSGKLDKMIDKWCGSDSSKKVLEQWTHKKDYTGENGVLRFAAEPSQEPMVYMGPDGKLIGLEVDIMQRIAYDLNRKLEILPMNFGSLIEALLSGRADMAGGCMSITAERKETVDFTDTHYLGGVAILVRNSEDESAAAKGKNNIRAVTDLAGRRVACLTGSAFPQLTEPLVKNVKYQFYNDNILSVQALRTGKVDAVLFDEPIAQMFASSFADDVAVACIYAEDHYGFACRKGSSLTAQASAVIQQMKSSGEIKKLKEKWCGSDKSKKVLEKWAHRKNYTGRNGVLRFAADPVQEPMCYTADGEQLIGLELDVMHRIAYDLDMKLVVIPMNFGSLIEALLSGRADMVGGSMSITADRKEKVDFAEAHYDGGLTILVRREHHRPETNQITRFSQLYGKRIGVLTGTSMDRVAQKFFPSSKPVFFNAFADMPVALKTGKIEGFLNEEPQARLMARKIPGLRILPRKLSSDDYAFVFSPKEEELCGAFNVELRKMKKDGTLKKLDEKWFSGKVDQKMPPAVVNPPKGFIRFATVPQSEPFSFLRNGQVVGYDIEIANLIAAKLGYGLKPMITEWGGYVETVASGKARFGVGCTTVTEERKQQVLFSEPDYQGGVVVVVADVPTVREQSQIKERLIAFCKGLKTSFVRTFVRESRWKLILEGLKITVLITVLSAFVGTFLAFGVCALRRARNRLIAGLGHAYVALMQGMPILVILMILYYVIFAKVDISAVIVAVIGFSMNFAAYAGEMFRTGIDGIPRGQSEAAWALGFTRWQAFRKVILPQVLRRILPIYRGEFVSMLKMTSIVGYIAIQDLTKMSDIIRSRTYEAFFPLIITAVIYFLSAHLLAGMISWVEYRLDPMHRRTVVKGEDI